MTPLKTLVLLPGMDGTGQLFAPLLRALDPDISTVVLQYPGQEPLDYSALEALVRRQLPSTPYVLLGESFSGPIALSIAATAPEGLCGVILCGSFASNPRKLAGVFSPLLSLPLGLPPSWLLSTALLGGFETPALRAMLVDALATVSTVVLRKRLSEVARVDMRTILGRIKQPVLYLQAHSDRVVPRHAALDLMAAMPHIQLVSLEGPHLLLQANPVGAANLIQGFLAESTQGAKARSSKARSG